jgi:hypothetical protein
LGKNGAAAVGSVFVVFRGLLEKQKGKSRLAPVAAEVFRKARRVTIEDKSTSPKDSDARISEA